MQVLVNEIKLPHNVYRIAMIPGTSTCVAACGDGNAYVVDVGSTCRIDAVLQGHQSWVYAVAAATVTNGINSKVFKSCYYCYCFEY